MIAFSIVIVLVLAHELDRGAKQAAIEQGVVGGKLVTSGNEGIVVSEKQCAASFVRIEDFALKATHDGVGRLQNRRCGRSLRWQCRVGIPVYVCQLYRFASFGKEGADPVVSRSQNVFPFKLLHL
jgi:hypothetical protein